MTNIEPDVEKSWMQRLYTNLNVGILSMFVAVITPFFLPILGSFLAPFLFIGGVIAVGIAKQSLWLKLLVVAIFIVPLVVFWEYYVYTIFYFTESVIAPD